ncbi:hypothetical protein NOGI109294_27285 [Nocardiopsis gilva]
MGIMAKLARRGVLTALAATAVLGATMAASGAVDPGRAEREFSAWESRSWDTFGR